MRRTIEFTRYRVPMLIISLVVIVAGLVVTVQRGGFNLSVDLEGGLSQQIQIARAAITLDLDEGAELQILVRQATERLIIRMAGGVGATELNFVDYPTLGDLSRALADIPGVAAARSLQPDLSSVDLIPESPQPSGGRMVLHAKPDSGEPLSIDEVRNALGSIVNKTIKRIGPVSDQQFVIRVKLSSEDDTEMEAAQERVRVLLASAFGADSLIIRSTDFVGRRFSQILGQQAVWLVVVALLLIMVYVAFRFRPEYSVAALVAVAHDVVVLIGVLGAFQIEVSTATIAALLTIVGYSLNDTIVIFDRVRENVTLMRDAGLRRVIDASITQSLARTIITSMTTLLAVVAIYVFATGPIQVFALAVIIGVVVGTYSSMYIAAPVVLLLQRRKRSLEGVPASSAGVADAPIAKRGAGTPQQPADSSATTDSSEGGAVKPAVPRLAGPRAQPVSKRRNKKKGR